MGKASLKAQNPILLRFHRLMDAFAKSDDERDFYLDKTEGFIVYVDLDKGEQEVDDLEKELLIDHPERYCLLPKMTFYETKKFMEGFVNEKVYDIDTKEKLLDIIQAKEARENFLEFIYDHLTELEKWQQFYQERSRIRIIEWLRLQQIQFVFEEDLDFLEGQKKAKFEVAIPIDSNSKSDGRFHAFLPTNDRTQSCISINGAFFPTTARKEIRFLEESENNEAKWNSIIIQSAFCKLAP